MVRFAHLSEPFLSVIMAEVICSVILSQVASVQVLTSIPTTRPTLGRPMPTGRSNEDWEETSWLDAGRPSLQMGLPFIVDTSTAASALPTVLLSISIQ